MRSVIFVHCILILGILGGCSSETAEEKIKNAEILLEQGELNPAIIELKNAVVLQPNDPSSRILLAETFLSVGSFPEAEKEASRAIDLGISLERATPTLLRAIYYQNDFERVLSLIDDLDQEQLSGAVVSQVHFYQYMSAIHSPETDRTKISFPDDLYGDYLLIARAYQALIQSNAEASFGFISEFSTNKETQFEKEFLKGTLYSLTRDHVAAIVALQNVLEQYPNFFVARFNLVEQLIADKQYGRALDEAEVLLRINPDSGLANALKAESLFLQEQFEEALQVAITAVQSGDMLPKAYVIAGISAYKTGRLETALRYLETAASNLPSGHSVHNYLAQVRLELGYINEIIEDIDMMPTTDAKKSEIYGLAALQKLKVGDVGQASKYVDEAMTLSSENPVSLLGKGLLALQNDEDAIPSLSQVTDLAPELSEGWILLAQAELKNNGIGAAVNVAKVWQKDDPVNGLLLEGFLYIQNVDPDTAKTAFLNVLEIEPNNSSALHYLAIINARNNQFVKANEYAEKLVQQENVTFFNVIDYLNIQIGLNEKVDLVAVLKEKISQQPDLDVFKTALAAVYNWKSQPEETINLLKNQDKNTDSNRYLVLGKAYLAKSQFDDAIKVFTEWTKNYPADSRGWLRLITTYQLKKDYKGGLDQVNAAQRYFPKHLELKALEATMLLNLGQDQKALKVINSIDPRAVKNIKGVEQVKGIIAYNNGQYKEATDIFASNWEHSPSFTAAKYYAFALVKNGDKSTAIELLKSERDKLSEQYVASNFIAEFATNNDMLDEAQAEFEKLMAQYQEDPAILNNFSMLKLKQGKPAEALKTIEKAYKLKPDSPYITDTYGLALLSNGDAESAVVMLEKARSKVPGNVDIALNYVEALIATGDKNNAQRVLNNMRPINAVDKKRAQQLNAQLNN